LFAAFVVLVLAAWLAVKFFPTRSRDSFMAWWKRPIASFVILALVFLGARGTLDHRPINPATGACSADAMVNALALTALYSVFDAAYRMRDERSSAAMYPKMAVDEMNAIVREKAGMTGAPMDPKLPSLHEQK
ncbi:hypothetical protein LLE87_27670, partial [Paenibacillus polymyxa]|nr:hypothetical protein [Paenibacillus polymyxa]